eukprot:COSAG01_NODE_12901_length_1667_cov_1.987883_1_plen_155_part_00
MAVWVGLALRRLVPPHSMPAGVVSKRHDDVRSLGGSVNGRNDQKQQQQKPHHRVGARRGCTKGATSKAARHHRRRPWCENDEGAGAQGQAPDGISFQEFEQWCCPKTHWQQAVLRNYADTPVHAVLALIAKLFVWHWLQPLLYFFVLYCTTKNS